MLMKRMSSGFGVDRETVCSRVDQPRRRQAALVVRPMSK
jgi:hypothetical protein